MAFSSAVFGPNTGTSMAARSAASNAGKKISQMGRGGDTMAIHATPFTRNLLRALGGSGGLNPKTGLTEFQPIDGLEGEEIIEGEEVLSAHPATATTGGAYDGMSYGSYGIGDNDYAYDLGLQVKGLSKDGFSDNYSQNDAGELVYTNYDGDTYTLDPSTIDADFGNTNFMPNYGDLKYFTANTGTVTDGGDAGAVLQEDGGIDNTAMMNQLSEASGLPDGVTAVDSGQAVGSEEAIGGEQLTLGSDGLYYLNGMLANGNDSKSSSTTTSYVNGVKQLTSDTLQNQPVDIAASKDPTDYDSIGDVGFSAEMIQQALSAASLGDGSGLYSEFDVNGDGKIDSADALEAFKRSGSFDGTGTAGVDETLEGGEQVFDANGAVIGTMLDGVFTPVSAQEGETKTSDDLANTVVDGVLENTDPNNFAGQIDTLKAEIAKLSTSPEDDAELEGIDDFDGLITKLTELFEKYMTSGYSPAALLNMFGFTEGNTSQDFNFMIPTYSGSDNVYTRKAVKDRDTGEIRYINVPIGDVASGGGSLQDNRRAGFGSTF